MPTFVSRREALLRREPSVDLSVRVGRAGLAGIARAELERGTGLSGDDFDAALAKLSGEDAASVTRDSRCVAETALAALEARLLEALDAYHRAEPLRPGMPKAALRGSLPENVLAAVSELAMERLASRDALRIDGDLARRPDHRVELDESASQLVERIAVTLADAALEAPSLRDLAATVDSDPAALGDLLAHLEREGKLVRAPGDLWFDAAAVEALRERLRAYFRDRDTLDTPTYKGLIGTTRRTAVPLMELLDTERFTARRGEVRVLRKSGQES